MKNLATTNVALLALALLCFSCGPAFKDLGEPVPQVRSLDGVKLIQTGVSDGYDKSTYLQDQYTLQPGQSRLLLRFNSMNSKIDQIRTDGDNKVELRIGFLSESDAKAAMSSLSVCPLSKNWMMLATWENAAPFGDSDQWGTPGGDYHPSECVHASTEAGAQLKFDVTSWFINYLQARRVNYGLILIADQSSTILGENSGSLSPRLLWNE